MKQFPRVLLSVCLLLSSLFCARFAQAQRHSPSLEAPYEPSCESPASAARALSYFAAQTNELSPERYCVDRSSRTPGSVAKLLRSFPSLLAARGLMIDPGALSAEADFLDPTTGRNEAVLVEGLPQIRLRKQGSSGWILTRSSLDRIEFLRSESPIVASALVASLPDWLRLDFFGVEAWQLLALSLVVIVGLVLRKVLQHILRRRLAPLVRSAGVGAVGHLVDVFAGPGSTLVMAALLGIFYPQLGLPFGAAAALGVAVRALFIFAIVLGLYRFVDVLADQMGHRAAQTDSKLDDQLVPLVRKALKVVVVVAGVLFLLQNLDVDVGSLLAGLGIGGVAVALAAKDTVANFFGSLMIFIDRPFQIGDWVKIADVEGVVEEVGFRSTRVRTFYNSLVTIPNAQFTEASIDNMGKREYRRTFTVLNLTYDTTPEQMQAFVEGVRAIIGANDTTRKDYYEVHFSGFGAHSLDVMVYFFFKVDSWTEELNQRHHLYLEILRLAKELKVEFAFPTQTLLVDHLAAPGAERSLPQALTHEELKAKIEAFAKGGVQAQPNTALLSQGYLATPKA